MTSSIFSSLVYLKPQAFRARASSCRRSRAIQRFLSLTTEAPFFWRMSGRPAHRRNVDEIKALRRLDVQQVLVVIQLFVGLIGMKQRVPDGIAHAWLRLKV